MGFYWDLHSGSDEQKYGKSPFSMDKSTFFLRPFFIAVVNYRRVYQVSEPARGAFRSLRRDYVGWCWISIAKLRSRFRKITVVLIVRWNMVEHLTRIPSPWDGYGWMIDRPRMPSLQALQTLSLGQEPMQLVCYGATTVQSIPKPSCESLLLIPIVTSRSCLTYFTIFA